MTRNSILMILLLTLTTFLSAVTKIVTINALDDLFSGKTENIAIDSESRLSLGYNWSKIPGPAEEYYLGADFFNNEIVIGSGHKGSVYKLSLKGSVQKLASFAQPDIYAVQILKNGDIVVGTSPRGKVFLLKKGKENEPKEIFDTQETFIWDIKEDNNGRLVIATGNNGVVYVISREGNLIEQYNVIDNNLPIIFISRDNSIYAGGGESGNVYRFFNKKSSILFNAELDEVRAICEDEEGNLFIAANRNPQNQKSLKELDKDLVSLLSVKKETNTSDKRRSIIYFLPKGKGAEKVWSSEKEIVFSLAYSKEMKKVFIATGNEGRIYSLSIDGSYQLIFSAEEAQVFKLINSEQGIIAICNNGPAIYQVSSSIATKGDYYSKIIDLKRLADLGRITWRIPSGATENVSVTIRAGNSPSPDKNWSDWSAPLKNAENSYATLKGVKFFQFRVSLTATAAEKSPQFSDFTIFYNERNVGPRFVNLKILKPGEMISSDKKVPEKKLYFKWEFEDENGDTLNYRLAIKKRESINWLELRKRETKNEFELDMEKWEDGLYQIKIEADDFFENSQKDGVRKEQLSTFFVVDSRPPELLEFNKTSQGIKFIVEDNFSEIKSVSFSFDAREWFAIPPDDMIFDSRRETFNLQINDLRLNRVIFIKVSDLLNNEKIFHKEL